LRDDYARYYGYDPDGNWILIVHVDNSTEFYRFEDPADMWCCKRKYEIGAMLDAEVRASHESADQNGPWPFPMSRRQSAS